MAFACEHTFASVVFVSKANYPPLNTLVVLFINENVHKGEYMNISWFALAQTPTFTHGHVMFLSLVSLDNPRCWCFYGVLLCACHLPVAARALGLAIAEMLALAAVQYSVRWRRSLVSASFYFSATRSRWQVTSAV